MWLEYVILWNKVVIIKLLILKLVFWIKYKQEQKGLIRKCLEESQI